MPQDARDPAYSTWRDGSAARTGGANVWSVMVADPERDLVFLPTSSPAPDYFGGVRRGENRYGNSIVALRASTGKLVWHFQTVHHDLWDYDNASPPALTTVTRSGARVPAVLQATKTGMLFVLHRETGEPLLPGRGAARPEEHGAGRGGLADPALRAPASARTAIPPTSAWGPTPEARAWCRDQIAALRNEGIFTPPSLEGTLVVPGNIGGAHWGGVAVDEARQIAVVPVNRVAAVVQLFARRGVRPRSAASRGRRARPHRLGIHADGRARPT